MSLELTYEEMLPLVQFKFELVRPLFRCRLSELPKGTLFFESERWLGLSGCGGVINYVQLQEDGRYFISFLNSNAFTYRDSNMEVYCPAIYKQLSGKLSGNIFYFRTYESYRHLSASIGDVKRSMLTEKRWFLPSYLPEYVK